MRPGPHYIYYRPKRKHELVNHLSGAEHRHEVRVPLVARHWTVPALTELHDSIHAKRSAPEGS